jgi:hypothetical protein
MMIDKQLTDTWHVDNLKCSYIDQEVSNDFQEWYEKDKYGDSKATAANAAPGSLHEYLAMNLNFLYKKVN